MRAGRDTRGLGCVAAAVVVTARGVAGGLLSFSRLGSRAAALARASFGPFLAFFRGRCEPRTPGVGRVGLRVGGLGLCGEIALQKREPKIIFVCLGVSSSARALSGLYVLHSQWG